MPTEPTCDAAGGELPAVGRVYSGRRAVRLSDAGADRRARLDALARYLHDVAEDDATDAGLGASVGWVLRRTRIDVRRFPVLGEELTLHTFCSATASRWAERTTVIRGASGASLRAVAIWVALDATSGGPTRLDERFYDIYGPAAAGRRASARLVLPPPSPEAREHARRWPLRSSDVDVWGHVNNAISWAAVEDASQGTLKGPLVAELEHPQAIDPTMTPLLACEDQDGTLGAWLLGGSRPEQVLAAARVVHAVPPDQRSRRLS